jgi:hypothetical protein
MYINPRPIQPTEVVAGSIAIYANIWKDTNKIIESIEDSVMNLDSEVHFERAQTFGDLKTGDPLVQTQRTNLILSLNKSGHLNESIREINNNFHETLLSAIRGYINIFGIEDTIFTNEEYNLLKYSGGQHYNAHYDGGTSSKRSISAILYINSDYEGGEIEFVNFGLKLKPGPGMLLLFPSNYAYRHIAHTVTSGLKYAIVTFLHDRE